ncbi:TetR/AcrR family transcriptional regulator [Microbacterium halophytorum]|uniref:TetR/AcrR family transcriptional regulator n=1 Tax=Microbacterium halophytorum TaxID=2067568 RepID=UPI001E2F64DF|nr:TetR/AcrR family transcriptional regulator [Microbacterium halophytorum]
MTTTTGASRAERTARTREALVQAAFHLFAERGFRAVSLRDVAKRAGVSHPALLKHFPDKDALLAATLERLELDAQTDGLDAVSPAELGFSQVARHNAGVPGYLPLFASLVGEASAATHPAHDALRSHALRFRAAAADVLAGARDDGVFASDRDPGREALRMAAAWDAVQVMEQYLPDRVDTARALERHEELLCHPVGWRAAGDVPHGVEGQGELPHLVPEAEDELRTGYRAGRARRRRIIEDATCLFAREGYTDTSLRDIAAQVGVSKSALYHHFPSKEALLLAVAEERDRRIDELAQDFTGRSGSSILRSMPESAATNERDQPGLVELYAVLSCEAVPPTHAAHDYFARRFARTLDSFESLFRAAAEAGTLPAHRDPAHEAIWFVALWDGLQYHWLYDRDGVDVAANLRAHFDDVLPG